MIRDAASPTGTFRTAHANSLLATVQERDLAILTALHAYRYLDSQQLHLLLFRNWRHSRRRLRTLADRELLHRWMRVERPGLTRRPHVYLISPIGATVLAGSRGHRAEPYVRASREAWLHNLHVDHDLEANGFFVDLAIAGAPFAGQGLYHWLGENMTRAIYRDRGARFVPDGWGRYLHASGEVIFFLEWDRNTEPADRLRRKLDAYVRFFGGRQDAWLANVLIAAPAPAREASIRSVLAGCLRDSPPTCSFWTSTHLLLSAHGPLGPVWAGLQGLERSRLVDLPSGTRSERPVGDSIAKPAWWMRRPGGGEVA